MNKDNMLECQPNQMVLVSISFYVFLNSVFYQEEFHSFRDRPILDSTVGVRKISMKKVWWPVHIRCLFCRTDFFLISTVSKSSILLKRIP